MRINHNITALNTYNKLTANNAATTKSLEKLSSGLKINRAGDNAAGLAISEKMRGQIRGLDQSSSNASDGISLIQTAEGALNETHSILQRMRELAVQSANDTNTDADRAEIQKEVDQLKNEITRISTDTEFNTKTLLNGDYGTKAVSSTPANVEVKSALSDKIGSGVLAITASTVATKEVNTGDANVSGVGVTFDATNNKLEINGTSITFANGATVQADIISKINEYSSSTGVTASASGNFIAFTANEFGTGHDMTFGGSAATNVVGTVTNTVNAVDATITADGQTHTAKGNEVTITTGNYTGLVLNVAAGGASNITVSKTELDFQIGANEDQTMSISLQNMSSESLSVDDIDLSSAAKATAAITTIDEAISSVSSERAKLGAYQNRLEHTINNLGTSSENLTSAESRIRDVDMAKEMMEFTKNNILSQAAQSMLAQANQQPQGVLQLLQ